MAILNRDEYFEHVRAAIGDRSDDESVKFLEDMTDTYNSLEDNITHRDGEDWEQRYHDLDNQWKKRYKERFFSGRGGNPNGLPTTSIEEEEKVITIDGLFE